MDECRDFLRLVSPPVCTSSNTVFQRAVKALLLLDNAPSHPGIATLVCKDSNITAMFLPPNTTSLFQPMDQGVLEALKRRYRKALLQKIL